jgi:hypothetical protein
VAETWRAGGEEGGMRAEMQMSRRRPGMDAGGGRRRRENKVKWRILSHRRGGLRRRWCRVGVVAAARSQGAASQCVSIWELFWFWGMLETRE